MIAEISNSYILRDNININIIGDSIAAGAGCSGSIVTDRMIFEDEIKQYFARISKNSWWGLLEAFLKENYTGCSVVNNGCGGAFSYQISQQLDNLISDDDDIVIVLMGLNDRKRKDGMKELKYNCENIVDRLVAKGKAVVLCTPTPSVHSNEYYPNRIHHTDTVCKIISEISRSKGIKLVDNYCYVNNYLSVNGLTIDDIIYGENCKNDGLHPSDFVQHLMFENYINECCR